MLEATQTPTRDRGDPAESDFARRVSDLYGTAGLSIRRIAAVLQVPRTKVAAALRSSGVAVLACGAGRPRPQTRAPRPPHLRPTLLDLYVAQRLTRAEVASILGVPDSRVRTWLVELGVPARPRGGVSREDRRRVAKESLVKLYVRAELPADRVGERLGSTRRVVLASAHEHGIPVRPGGASTNARAIAVLQALYDDHQVVEALRRHGIPVVRRGGAVADRFPRPVRLTAAMLAALYVECGLSATQIELVTGQPAATVGRRLRVAGLLARPAGGLAPFTRRARQVALNGRARVQATPRPP